MLLLARQLSLPPLLPSFSTVALQSSLLLLPEAAAPCSIAAAAAEFARFDESMSVIIGGKFAYNSQQHNFAYMLLSACAPGWRIINCQNVCCFRIKFDHRTCFKISLARIVLRVEMANWTTLCNELYTNLYCVFWYSCNLTNRSFEYGGRDILNNVQYTAHTAHYS